MLYPVELWDHAVARWQRVTSAKMWRFGHTTNDRKGHKKRARIHAHLQRLEYLYAGVKFTSDERGAHRSESLSLADPFAQARGFVATLLVLLGLLVACICSRALGAASGRRRLAARRTLGVRRGRSTLGAAARRLGLVASGMALPSVDAEAPLEQQLADLDLSHDAFLSLEQVCSVLALLSAGASVDWADAVNAKNAKAPRKRNFFIELLSFIDRRKHQNRCSVGKIQTPSVCDAGRERISLFLPSRNSQARETHADNSWRGGRVVMQQPAKL